MSTSRLHSARDGSFWMAEIKKQCFSSVFRTEVSVGRTSAGLWSSPLRLSSKTLMQKLHKTATSVRLLKATSIPVVHRRAVAVVFVCELKLRREASTFRLLLLRKYSTRVSVSISIDDNAPVGPAFPIVGVEDYRPDLMRCSSYSSRLTSRGLLLSSIHVLLPLWAEFMCI